MRVLVTGAGGFAGGHVLETLAAQGMAPIAACRDRRRLYPGFDGEAREGDLRDSAYLREALGDIDCVCHCAAWSSLWNHAEASRRYFLEPSLALLEAAERAGVARIVFVSTASAGAPRAGRDPARPGMPRRFWPHLDNVIAIENRLRVFAERGGSAVVLRCGLFVGERYGLGVLPVLLPRLKSHLVPWVDRGRTPMPLLDGRDLGRAFLAAVRHSDLRGYRAFNILGPEVPTVREVLEHLHREYGYPMPHFSVPFPVAYGFGWLMEALARWTPWDPLVTRSIIHLLEDTGADHREATAVLGYRPQVHWRTAIADQLREMGARRQRAMPMAGPLA